MTFVTCNTFSQAKMFVAWLIYIFTSCHLKLKAGHYLRLHIYNSYVILTFLLTQNHLIPPKNELQDMPIDVYYIIRDDKNIVIGWWYAE